MIVRMHEIKAAAGHTDVPEPENPLFKLREMLLGSVGFMEHANNRNRDTLRSQAQDVLVNQLGNRPRVHPRYHTRFIERPRAVDRNPDRRIILLEDLDVLIVDQVPVRLDVRAPGKFIGFFHHCLDDLMTRRQCLSTMEIRRPPAPAHSPFLLHLRQYRIKSQRALSGLIWCVAQSVIITVHALSLAPHVRDLHAYSRHDTLSSWSRFLGIKKGRGVCPAFKKRCSRVLVSVNRNALSANPNERCSPCGLYRYGLCGLNVGCNTTGHYGVHGPSGCCGHHGLRPYAETFGPCAHRSETPHQGVRDRRADPARFHPSGRYMGYPYEPAHP